MIQLILCQLPESVDVRYSVDETRGATPFLWEETEDPTAI